MGTEEVSRLLFGRAMRLPILMWIRDRNDPAFFQGEVHAATNYPQSAVADELTRFDELGLIAKQERANGRQYYQRLDESPLWDIVDAARSAVGGAGAKGGGADADILDLRDDPQLETEGRMLL